MCVCAMTLRRVHATLPGWAIPPTQAVQQAASTALQGKIQAKMQPFLTAKGDFQTAQQRLQQSRSAAANAATVAQARYAKYITGVNQKNQTAVAQYNQHLLSSLQQYAPQYDAAVAQQNLQDCGTSHEAHAITPVQRTTELPGAKANVHATVDSTTFWTELGEGLTKRHTLSRSNCDGVEVCRCCKDTTAWRQEVDETM